MNLVNLDCNHEGDLPTEPIIHFLRGREGRPMYGSAAWEGIVSGVYLQPSPRTGLLSEVIHKVITSIVNWPRRNGDRMRSVEAHVYHLTRKS